MSIVGAKNNTLRPRAAVEQMREYHPPLAGRDGLRLDFNENTHAPSPRVASVLQRMAAEGLTKYPERDAIERVAAAHFGLDARGVLLTNGVDEAIHLLCETYLGPEDEVLIVTPTFSMFALYVEATGATVSPVQAGPDLQFPETRVLDAVNDRTRMVLIASPNNPTGAVAEKGALLRLARMAPQAAVLVDEAYYHFHGETVLPETASVPNLFVTRTFSKAYGLAGLRIGMLAGHPDAVRFVRKVSSPYNVNNVALACLPEALADGEYLRWYTEEVRTARAELESALQQMGVPFWPSQANFVLMRIGPAHAALVDAMRRRGVLVRDRSSDPGCDGCVRITVGTRQHTQQGAAALRESLEEIQWRPEN